MCVCVRVFLRSRHLLSGLRLHPRAPQSALMDPLARTQPGNDRDTKDTETHTRTHTQQGGAGCAS